MLLPLEQVGIPERNATLKEPKFESTSCFDLQIWLGLVKDCSIRHSKDAHVDQEEL